MLSKIFILLTFTGLMALLLPRLTTKLHAWTRTQSVDEVPTHGVAIIFGAGLWRDGSPTPVLRDRVATGAELFFAGKAEKLLMSGDNSFDDYNEPAAMRDYAISLGVPEDAIVLDYAGRRTYDTCFRARDIFELDAAILVTQGFHLPRALYTCNALGIAAIGVEADQRIYRRRSLAYWHTRETLATLVAMLEVDLLRRLPVLGEREPIFTETTKIFTAETQSSQRNY